MEHFFYNTDSSDLPWFGDDEVQGKSNDDNFVSFNPNPDEMLAPQVAFSSDYQERTLAPEVASRVAFSSDYQGRTLAPEVASRVAFSSDYQGRTLAPEVASSSHYQHRNDYEKEQCSRHVINERMRREKQKTSFMRLHSLLPTGTKKDRNSIIITAAKTVEELNKHKQKLEKENSEIKKMLCSEEEVETEKAKININVAYPSSGLDSMLEVLKCLKQTRSKIGVIQSKFSAQEFSAVLGIETKAGAAEVEKAVHLTLFEVEKKFHLQA